MSWQNKGLHDCIVPAFSISDNPDCMKRRPAAKRRVEMSTMKDKVSLSSGTRCNPLPLWIHEWWSLSGMQLGTLYWRDCACTVFKFSPRSNGWEIGMTLASHVCAQLPICSQWL